MNALLAIAVIGITEFIKRLRDKDWVAAGTIIIAAAIGAGAGALGIEGLDVAEGLIAGLSAVGVHTVAKQVG